jgi:thiamine biosynthesis lipoprotein
LAEAPSWWDAVANCQTLVERLEAMCSRFRPDSELNRLRRGAQLRPSAELAAVLAAAETARVETAGAFDARRHASIANRPDPAAPDAPYDVDLGGIAKGYAADAVRDLCRSVGCRGACVSFGTSSVSSHGTRAAGDPWRIALRDPAGDRRTALGWLELPAEWSLSVSGFTERGVHIIDPRTAAPASSAVIQAAVATPRGMSAETWSTALVVLGVAGLENLLAHHPNAHAVLVTTEQVIATPGWFRRLPIANP